VAPDCRRLALLLFVLFSPYSNRHYWSEGVFGYRVEYSRGASSADAKSWETTEENIEKIPKKFN